MNQIFVTILLLGLVTPALGVTAVVGGEVGGGISGSTANACGCDWDSDVSYYPDGMLDTCLDCNDYANDAIGCMADAICDDYKSGNSYGVIVGSTNKLTVNCGTWVPAYKEPGTNIIREGYWSTNPSASCDTIATYRCGAGYYGKPTSGTSGCTKCPNFDPNDSNSVISSEIPRTSITNCYIKPNKTMSDSTGTYTYTDGCFYDDRFQL